MTKEKNQKNNKKWLIGLAIVVLVAGFFIFRDLERLHRIKTTQAQKYVQYSGRNGKTVLDLLKEHDDVEYTRSDLGVFVVSIDNLQSTDKDFWIYYVDGKMGPIAADKYQTKNGEKIEWKYEALQ